ncbi:pyrroloquinoline quinone biosynthesis protein PqqB [Nocardia sp. CDC159]|uniref:Coenzyme PQQ synthesis protein B n=1 Tax=Nocardia pulmonis TaxID=2951408 RepID=A0A9X2J189_9NOCA|nr:MULTISPECIES: pyrroloquinoline quinone biosynthesis protein PqqB [Nocardia]MCM6778644.1 pyrroloquinoline quinone biosynthesis protein PqqB [Nocardia pulmonis]MCM6791533.1 pyrroloquinoline quinone biosynthesis protein PqqB [Nocardia sp. CDC159]
MRVVLLGTAAGGGVPQWNCACARCADVRRGVLPARTQDCVAVSGNARDWWLLNASPDIRTQLSATPALRPGPGPRETPVRGVLLTDAELDHALGLTILRGGAGLTGYATAPVRAALDAELPLRGLLDRYAPWTWRDGSGDFELAGGLRVTGLPVGAKAPKYVHSPEPDDRWVSAFRIDDPATGGALVYAPCLARWPDGLDALLADADCALVDGTFFDATELGSAVGRRDSGQALMGHLPVAGPGGTLAALARHPGPRRIYTHLNNTNPLLDPASAARAQVERAGVEVLPDGTEFAL